LLLPARRSRCSKNCTPPWFAASPGVKERLSSIGAESATLSSAEFGAMIKRDIARWKEVARQANIKFD